ncbi:MAG: hypothetical protein QXR26_06730, partial [Candidatus Caldarchaeum sp.]
MTATIKDVLARVDVEKTIKRTLDLANVESPTGFEGECAELYARMMEEVGMRVKLQEVEQGRYNAVGILPGKGGGPSLMFNGHLDTSFSPR